MTKARVEQAWGKMTILYKDGGKAIAYNPRTQTYYFYIGFQALLDGSFTGASTSHGSTPREAYISYLDKYEQEKIKRENIFCPHKLAALEGAMQKSLKNFESVLGGAGIDPYGQGA